MYSVKFKSMRPCIMLAPPFSNCPLQLGAGSALGKNRLYSKNFHTCVQTYTFYHNHTRTPCQILKESWPPQSFFLRNFLLMNLLEKWWAYCTVFPLFYHFKHTFSLIGECNTSSEKPPYGKNFDTLCTHKTKKNVEWRCVGEYPPYMHK